MVPVPEHLRNKVQIIFSTLNNEKTLAVVIDFHGVCMIDEKSAKEYGISTSKFIQQSKKELLCDFMKLLKTKTEVVKKP